MSSDSWLACNQLPVELGNWMPEADSVPLSATLGTVRTVSTKSEGMECHELLQSAECPGSAAGDALEGWNATAAPWSVAAGELGRSCSSSISYQGGGLRIVHWRCSALLWCQCRCHWPSGGD